MRGIDHVTFFEQIFLLFSGTSQNYAGEHVMSAPLLSSSAFQSDCNGDLYILQKKFF